MREGLDCRSSQRARERPRPNADFCAVFGTFLRDNWFESRLPAFGEILMTFGVDISVCALQTMSTIAWCFLPFVSAFANLWPE